MLWPLTKLLEKRIADFDSKAAEQLMASSGHNASTTRSSASLNNSCRPHGMLPEALSDVLRFSSIQQTRIMLRYSPRYANWQRPKAFPALDEWVQRLEI